MVVLMKLHWDIGSVTYPEFLPFIFDILAPNQVIFKFCQKVIHFESSTPTLSEIEILNDRPLFIRKLAPFYIFSYIFYLPNLIEEHK